MLSLCIDGIEGTCSLDFDDLTQAVNGVVVDSRNPPMSVECNLDGQISFKRFTNTGPGTLVFLTPLPTLERTILRSLTSVKYRGFLSPFAIRSWIG